MITDAELTTRAAYRYFLKYTEENQVMRLCRAVSNNHYYLYGLIEFLNRIGHQCPALDLIMEPKVSLDFYET